MTCAVPPCCHVFPQVGPLAKFYKIPLSRILVVRAQCPLKKSRLPSALRPCLKPGLNPALPGRAAFGALDSQSQPHRHTLECMWIRASARAKHPPASFFFLHSLVYTRTLRIPVQMYDDLDLDVAAMKLLAKGGHGGHNGCVHCSSGAGEPSPGCMAPLFLHTRDLCPAPCLWLFCPTSLPGLASIRL